MRALSLAAFLLLPGVCASAAEPQARGATVAAVWKHQKLEFQYFGRTSRYSCDGLRDKVRAMLLEMGARSDLRLRTRGCEIGRVDLAGLNPGLSIEFFSAAPRADTEKEPVSVADGVQPFDARYADFDFRQDAFRNLSVGDCELVEEFARQVLPKFVLRQLKQDITCVPFQRSGGRYLVSGEVLRPLPADGAARR